MNSGTKPAVWDRVYGTRWLPKREPAGYGPGGVVFPEEYFQRYTLAFRPFRWERAGNAAGDLSR